MDSRARVTSPIDDPTAAYVVETGRPFEDLRQVASQLAGLLVLAAAGAKTVSPDHPMLDATGTLCAEAYDIVRGARPTPRARPHHQHLLRAAAALEAALAEARARIGSDRPAAIDPILIPLQSGYEHLRRAAASLPGFELIAFAGGCCALHRDSTLPAHET